MFSLLWLACSAPAPSSPAEVARLSFERRLELPPPTHHLEAMVLADLRGDGQVDLVQVEHDHLNLGLVRLIRDVFDPTSAPVDVELDGRRIQGTSALVEDFDVDGVGDLALGWYDSVDVLRGAPDGGFFPPVTLDLQAADQGPSRRLSAARFDGDDRPDLLVAGWRPAGSAADVWLDPLHGGRADRQTSLPTPHHHMSSAALVDLSGDGHPDLVTWTGDTLFLQRWQAGRLAAGEAVWSVDQPVEALVHRLPDVDGDGDEEVALRLSLLPGVFAGVNTFDPGDPGGGLIVWAGGGAVGPPIVLPDGTGGSAVAAGDVDDDGWPDLAVGDAVAGLSGVHLFLGGPDVFSPARSRFVPLPSGRTAVVAHGLVPGAALISWAESSGETHAALLPLAPADADADGDGWPTQDDPDDSRADVWPGAEEIVGDSVDQDGDGWDVCGLDADGDGFGVAAVAAVGGCTRFGLSNRVDPPDCQDHDRAIFPGAMELPGIERDMNCDGAVRCFGDRDGDGFGDPLWIHLPGDLDCDDPGEISAYMAVDCDDTRADVHPLAEEAVGDGVDADCEGQEICYGDADRDGGRSDRTVASWNLGCSDVGYARADTPFDCDDNNPEVGPFAEERPFDRFDQNCDGRELCALDADGDGFGGREELVLSDDLDCRDPGEGAAVDCDDRRSSVGLPGAGGCPPPGGCAQVGGAPACGGWLGLIALALRGRRR